MRKLLVSLVLLAIAQHCPGAENSEYFVFVGEKISVTACPPKEGEILFDEQFLAKYRVVEAFRGSHDGSEIEFVVYDHYGVPPFASFEHVLLYVQLHDGNYYHAKYQFSPLYKTKDGRWAGPYAAEDYGHEYNKQTAIKPEVIEFSRPVTVDVSSLEKGEIERLFPEPYFRIDGDEAIAVYGNYLPELFLLKQRGVLKARGDFQ
jgi:hypothetical protein